MIHICFSLYDLKGTYSKFVGAAMCSVFENTAEKIIIHIFHDITLSEENMKKLIFVSEKYRQQIKFYEIDIDKKFLKINSLDVYTIGTLFRLYIPMLLPVEIDKVIYLDADIILNLDIKILWNEEIKNYSLGVCIDEPLANDWWKHILCEQGLFEKQKYFNAGVLVLNLVKIRDKYNLLENGLVFFQDYPDNKCADQDALNYIFKNDICFLDCRYNTFTAGERRRNADIRKRIYHYSGEEGRANYLKRDCFDELFWSYLLKTPWGKKEPMQLYYEGKLIDKEKKYQWLCSSLQLIFSKKKIFWGSSGRLHSAIRSYFFVDKTTDYYVDNNPSLWDITVDDLPVYPPNSIQKECKESFVIIVVTLRYREVKKQLEVLGYIENKDFFDGRKFLMEAEGGYPEWNV